MHRIIPLLLLMFLVPATSGAVDTFETGYVDRLAAITIDGDLSDWEGIELPEYQITNHLNFRNVVPPSSEDDLSASFKCFADDEYVFVAITVTDDVVIIGNHPYGEGWNDDAAEICFDGDLKDTSKPYFDENDGQVRFTAGEDGVTLIEGAMPYLYETQPPYFWEARGVRGGFGKTETGYIIEAAIPVDVLGWDNVSAGQSIGMNIRIFDDDNEENGEMLDSGLSWAEDPQNTSFWKTQFYTVIIINKSISISNIVSDTKTESSVEVVKVQDREILLELNNPARNEIGNNIATILENVANDNWSEPLEIIESLGYPVWSLPIKYCVLIENNNDADALVTLLDINKKSPDQRVIDWSNNYFALMLSQLHERIDTPINLFNKLIPKMTDHPQSNEVKYLYAKQLFYNQEFDNSRNVCNEILNLHPNTEISLLTKMIMLSINRKFENNVNIFDFENIQ